jgi:hypothetical protein
MTRPRTPVSSTLLLTLAWLAPSPPGAPSEMPIRTHGAASARDLGRADVAPFIGLTGSLRYGRARHHLGSHWQDSDHE